MRLRSHARRPWVHVIDNFPFLRLPRDARHQIISFTSNTELVDWMCECLANRDTQLFHVFVEIGTLNVQRDEAGFPLITHILDASPREFGISTKIMKYVLRLPEMDINRVSSLRGVSALMACAFRGHLKWTKRLIALGCDVNLQTTACCDQCDFNLGNTALMWAVQQNKLDIVNLLIESQADLNKTNSKGWTPLMYAANSGYTEIVLSLVQAGADFEWRANEERWSALCMAAFNGHLEIVVALIEAGCDLEVSSLACCLSRRCHNVGKTPLVLAASQGHEEIVDVLIAEGVKLNTQTEHYGLSALIYAAKRNYDGIVQSLCAAGADVSLTDVEGFDAMQHAEEEENYHIVSLLEPFVALVDDD